MTDVGFRSLRCPKGGILDLFTLGGLERLTTAIGGLTGDNHLATTMHMHKACIAFFGIVERSIEIAPKEEAFPLRKHYVLSAGLGRVLRV